MMSTKPSETGKAREVDFQPLTINKTGSHKLSKTNVILYQ